MASSTTFNEFINAHRCFSGIIGFLPLIFSTVESLATKDSSTGDFMQLELVDSRDIVQVALEEMIPKRLMTPEQLDEILEDEGTVHSLLQDFGQRVLDYLNWKRVMREVLLAEVLLLTGGEDRC